MAINIPESIYTKFNEVVDTMITEFGVVCTLVYPEKQVACSNCITDTIGRKSGNRYRTGGPIPFARGMICPLCHGSGFKSTENTDEIVMRVYWKKQNWIKTGIQVDAPNDVVQTITYLKHLPKINKAKEVLINKNIQGHETLRYIKMGESVTNGLQHNRYIITHWRRS
jgi:hypothetical protein